MHFEASLFCPFCSYRFRARVEATCQPHPAQWFDTYCPQNKSFIDFPGKELKLVATIDDDLNLAVARDELTCLVTIDPRWLTRTVSSLAGCIHDEAAFDRLPLLADALEDAGCTDTAILEHCRGPGPHVRGCWVVDLLLGRS
jgi:hypothetical protein